jgi:cathepsin B
MTNGSVTAWMMGYEDLLSYKSGIYKHTTGHFAGGHSVKIIGWGIEGTEKFWIVANSWDYSWGENGLFRIAFG